MIAVGRTARKAAVAVQDVVITWMRLLVGGAGPRVTPLRQDAEVDCGPTCLAMILAHHGRPTPIAEVAERCHTGRGGANASDLAVAARSYGLRVDAFSLALDRLRDLPCPAVLHWNFSHFVVLERFEGGRATIVDPARGRRRVTRQEVSERFTGVALALSPGGRFDRREGGEVEAAWRLLARRALRAPGVKPLLRQMLLTSLLLQIVALAGPLLTKVIIDKVLPTRSVTALNVIGLGIAVIVVVYLVASLLRGLVLVTLTAKLDAEIMVSFVDHVLALPFRYFQEHSTGDLLNRLASNAQIRALLSNQIVTALLDGMFVVVYGLILFVAAPTFGSVVVAFAAVQIILIFVTRRAMTERVIEELTAQSTSQAFLVEAISGMESLKASGVENRTLTHWSGLLGGQLEASMRRARLSAVLSVLTLTVQTSSIVMLLWIGASLVLNGTLSLGSMLALIALSQLFLAPVNTLVRAALQLQQIGGHLERIANVLRVEPEQDLHRVDPAPVLRGAIELDEVSFRYDPNSPWAVRQVSLQITPGQRVALVGRSGSGKSTMAKLILGVHQPTEGTVRFDGRDLAGMDLSTVRTQCGAVMQDPALFNVSVRRNISYHDPELELGAVERAAIRAELHDDIVAMPLGYDTMIAERGTALSGGQRQRLAIARALAHDPALLVLDEATSDLDTQTEARVTANLSREGCTTIVIAHRMSTVRDADLILVMDHGQVIERGVHDQLLEQGGMYAALVRDQHGADTRRGADRDASPVEGSLEARRSEPPRVS